MTRTEIRPYMFETLMYLVCVHAQVSEVTPPLLDRTLNALVESLVEEALRCFKQVKRFGMGGMLRVGYLLFLSIRDLLRPSDTDRTFFFFDMCCMWWWVVKLTHIRTGHVGDRVHAPDTLTLHHVQHSKDALRPVHQDFAGVRPSSRGRELAEQPRRRQAHPERDPSEDRHRVLVLPRDKGKGRRGRQGRQAGQEGPRCADEWECAGAALQLTVTLSFVPFFVTYIEPRT